MSNSLLSNEAFNRVTVYNENENVYVEPLIMGWIAGTEFTGNATKKSDNIQEYIIFRYDTNNEYSIFLNYHRTKFKDTVVTTGTWNIHSLSNTEDNVVLVINRMTNIDIVEQATPVPEIITYDILKENGKFKKYKQMTLQRTPDGYTLIFT